MFFSLSSFLQPQENLTLYEQRPKTKRGPGFTVYIVQGSKHNPRAEIKKPVNNSNTFGSPRRARRTPIGPNGLHRLEKCSPGAQEPPTSCLEYVEVHRPDARLIKLDGPSEPEDYLTHKKLPQSSCNLVYPTQAGNPPGRFCDNSLLKLASFVYSNSNHVQQCAVSLEGFPNTLLFRICMYMWIFVLFSFGKEKT